MNDEHGQSDLGSPLLGTIASQSVEISRGSSERRSPESVCYEKLLRENDPSSPVTPQKITTSDARDCYGKFSPKFTIEKAASSFDCTGYFLDHRPLHLYLRGSSQQVQRV